MKIKQISPTFLNILMNLVSFLLTFGISFYITPYITQNVGMEAYGLVGMATNFTSYITIITAALNSMASRFIILQLHKGNSEKANYYFNSALFANILFALASMLMGILFIPNLENMLNINAGLVYDAKITFFLVFINFSLSMVFSVFSVGYYTTNKLYVGAFRTIQSDIIRIFLLFVFFDFIGVKIQYTVIATLLSSLVSYIYAIQFSKENVKKLKISVHYFKLKAVLEMVRGGVWNSISKLSQVLLNGLDLIITNLFIGGSIQGSVSVAKTFSSIIISLIGSVSDTFLPKFLKAYSKSNESLVEEFFKSTKVLGFFSCVLISLFVSYCGEFFQCWLPGEDWRLLKGLSIISLLSVFVSGPLYSMFSIYTVVNKVKPQALSTLVMSILSSGTVFILLKCTNLGVYAIVGTSSVYGTIKNLTYNMYCLKKYIGLDVRKCYSILFRNMLIIGIIVICSNWIKKLFEINNFFTLIGNGVIGGCAACLIYFLFGFNMVEKKQIVRMIFKIRK